jgi:hypothetical protein
MLREARDACCKIAITLIEGVLVTVSEWERTQRLYEGAEAISVVPGLPVVPAKWCTYSSRFLFPADREKSAAQTLSHSSFHRARVLLATLRQAGM